MKKLSFLVAVVFLFTSVLPISAFAEEAHTHCVCGATEVCDGHESVSFTAWISQSDVSSKGGNYYLNGDVTLSGNMMIYGTVNLCLNGHTMNVATVKFSRGASLIICDCTGKGKMTHTSALISIEQSNCTLRLYSGTLEATSNHVIYDATSATGSVIEIYGGTVLESGANTAIGLNATTLKLYGGAVTAKGNNAILTQGGKINLCGNTQISCGAGKDSIKYNSDTTELIDVAGYTGGSITIRDEKIAVGRAIVTGASEGDEDRITLSATHPDNHLKYAEGKLVVEDGARHIHSYTYAADDAADMITQSCGCGHSAAARLVLPESISSTGSELTPAGITYTGSWQGTDPTVTYTNNTEPGTASVSMTAGDKTVTGTFEIIAELKPITTVSFTVKAPVADNVPQSTVDAGTNCTGVILWEGEPKVFLFGEVYTARVEVTADTDYKFSQELTGPEGWSVEIIGEKAVFTRTFPAAERLPEVDIIYSDKTISYNDAPYDITGLFTIPTDAGAASYKVTPGTGEGTVSQNELTVTKCGTFEVTVTTERTEKYSQTSRTVTLTVERLSGSGSVSMEGWIYGEAPSEPQPASTANGTEGVSYRYEGRNGTVYSSEERPTNAGDYTVIATFPQTDIYAGTTASADFIISRAAISGDAKLSGEAVYGGTLTGSWNGASSVAYSWYRDGVLIPGIASAEYALTKDDVGMVITFEVTGTGNYTGSALAASEEVQPAKITDITVKQTGSLTYNGEKQTAEVSASGTTVGGEKIRFTYAQVSGGVYYDTVIPFTDAGTHKVWYIAAADGHAKAEGSFTVTIERADGEITYISDISKVYDGTVVHRPEVTHNGTGKITYQYSVKGSDQWSATRPTDAGEYTVRVTAAEDTNYKEAAKEQDFTISQKIITTVDFTVKPPVADNVPQSIVDACDDYTASIVWEGEPEVFLFGEAYTAKVEVTANTNYKFPQELTGPEGWSVEIIGEKAVFTRTFPAAERLPEVDIIYSDKTISYNDAPYDITGLFTIPSDAGAASYEVTPGTGEGTESQNELTVTKCGTFEITVTTERTENYSQTSRTVTLTVERISGSGFVIMSGWTYGRPANTPQLTSSTNGTENAVCRYEGINGTVYSSAERPADAGEYRITVTFPGTDIYKEVTAYDEFTIEKASMSVTEHPAAATYNGSAYRASVSAPDGASVAYGLTEGTYDLTEAPEFTDAGEYTVYYKVTKPNYNTVSGTLTVTIYKRDIKTVSVKQQGDMFYTGSAQKAAVTAAADTLDETGVFTYSLDQNGTYTSQVPGITATGTHTVYYKVSAENHNGTSGSFTVTIKAAEGAVTGVTDISKSYDGTAVEAPEFHSLSTGRATVEYAPYGTESWTEAAPKNAGKYSVKITVAADDNYTAAYAQGEFTISTVSLTVTANDNAIIYGEVPAANGAEITGFVAGEDKSVLSGRLSYSFGYERYGNVGTYRIIPQGLTSSNYTISFIPGELTVTSREVGLRWIDTVHTYTGSEKGPVAIATGLLNEDICRVEVTGQQKNAGTYTAAAVALSNGNYKLPENKTSSYTIEKAAQSAPELESKGETVKGKADGAITGLTQEMEYRREGDREYAPVNGTELLNLSAGKYFVRYTEKENYHPGTDAEVTVGSGRYIIVTFMADGEEYYAYTAGEYGITVPAPDAPQKADAAFAGWFKDEACTKLWNFTSDTPSEDTAVFAGWSAESAQPVSGNITGAASGAEITIKQGGETVLTVTSDSDGTFEFPAVDPGIYTVTVKTGDVTVTDMVQVTEDSAPTISVAVPTENVSSVLDAPEGENIAVSGFSDAAEAQKGCSEYRRGDP